MDEAREKIGVVMGSGASHVGVGFGMNVTCPRDVGVEDVSEVSELTDDVEGAIDDDVDDAISCYRVIVVPDDKVPLISVDVVMEDDKVEELMR